MGRTKGRKQLAGHRRKVKGGLASCECGWWAADKPRSGSSPWTPATADEARGRHLVDVRMELAP